MSQAGAIAVDLCPSLPAMTDSHGRMSLSYNG